MKGYRIQFAATLLAGVALVAPSVCPGAETQSSGSPYRRPVPVVTANYVPASQAPTIAAVRWGYRGYRPYYGRAYRPYYSGSRSYYRPYGYRTYGYRPYGYRPYAVRPYVYGYRPYGFGYYNPWYFGFGPRYY